METVLLSRFLVMVGLVIVHFATVRKSPAVAFTAAVIAIGVGLGYIF